MRFVQRLAFADQVRTSARIGLGGYDLNRQPPRPLMKSSQNTGYFEDEQEDFKDALMSLDVTAGESNAEPPATYPETPTKGLPRKRKHEEVDQFIEGESDINPHVLATMRQQDDKNDVYGASSFGGYGQYMARKRAKLQIQNADMVELKSKIFEGIEIYVRLVSCVPIYPTFCRSMV